MTTIIRFGENANEMWYETAEGRFQCNEDVLMKIWFEWINKLYSRRADSDDMIVYEFCEPTEINLAEKINFPYCDYLETKP